MGVGENVKKAACHIKEGVNDAAAVKKDGAEANHGQGQA